VGRGTQRIYSSPVFIEVETVSAHSASPRKIPGGIVLVREKFSVNKHSYGKQKFKHAISPLFISNFHLLKKLKINQYEFQLARGRKFSGEK